jgi:hypothetical protein
MNRTDRRKTLAVLAAALASPSIATGSPRGTFLAQAGLQTDAPGSQAPPSSMQPAAVVNGTYQAAYQDGYAPALLEIGFSKDVLLGMFSSEQQRMTINATSKTLWLQTPDGPLTQVPLNKSVEIHIFGAKIADWLAHFEEPTRLLTRFTAPNGRRVQASQTFRPTGLVTVLSIEGAPQFRPIRLWNRVSEPEAPKRPKPQLFPL